MDIGKIKFLFSLATLSFLTLPGCSTTIDSVSPSEVNIAGGEEVLINGDNLNDAIVSVDQIEVAVTTNTDKQITFIAPPNDPGKATITVSNSDGSDSYDNFSYVAIPENKYIIEYHLNDGLKAFIDDTKLYQNIMQASLEGPQLANVQTRSVNSLPYLIVNDLTEQQIEELLSDPLVKAIHQNTYREKHLEQSLEVVEQEQAYEWGATGDGYSIAILDTGVDYTQSDLGSCIGPGPDCKVLLSFDTAKEDGQSDADPYKHGTNVAAIASRMAPKAKIIAIDVFDKKVAFDDDILDALGWVISNREKYNIVAVNMSLGSPLKPGEVCQTLLYDNALKLLLYSGIQVVVSSGNTNIKDNVSYPACHPLAITVGATTDNSTPATTYKHCSDPSLSVDSVTCFSDSSEAVDVYAPGTNITAGGIKLSGTSQAAPHVAGSLAALKSKFRDKTTEELVLRIQQTGKTVTDSANGLTRKRLNLASAMNDAPVANDDFATALQGGGTIIDVLKNDNDEHIDKASISGLFIPDDEGIKARIINNEIYFYSAPDVHGTKTFRYTMTDEYGVSAAATVTVDIAPYSHPNTTIIDNDFSFRSHLIRSQKRPYIVYESGRFEKKEVWMQQLNESGELIKDRYLVSSDNNKVSPNYLEAVGDDEGYNIAWISNNNDSGYSRVMGAFGKDNFLPSVFSASYDFKGNTWNPTITLLKGRAMYGWEEARNPGDFMVQPMTRHYRPNPASNLQTLIENVAFTTIQDNIRVSDTQYLYLRAGQGSDIVSVRKFDVNGTSIWSNLKKLPDWRGNPPDFYSGLCCAVQEFDVEKISGGFAMAWTHAKYTGRYGVSFQTYDDDGNSTSEPLTILNKLNGMGGVQMVSFEDGSYRVFWNEKHSDFGAIVSLSISNTGMPSTKRIDYWTEQSNALWPYSISAIRLNNSNYMISWSNNQRHLMSVTREK